jgi:CheY-like chemotaxis protein
LPVLIVDDNPADQWLTAMQLEEAWPSAKQCQVEYALDGQEALTKLGQHPYGLLVLDWKLPVLGEGEVLRRLRAAGSRLPVVVVSGADREDIVADFDRLGAIFLSKQQMDPPHFQHAIHQACAQFNGAS